VNPKPIISGLVEGKRVSVQLDTLLQHWNLNFIRSCCALVEQKLLELNPLLTVEEMWTYDDRFNGVLTFLLNRSTPVSHLLYEYAVALRRMLKLLEGERLSQALTGGRVNTTAVASYAARNNAGSSVGGGDW
jgi:hypothetical protein